MFALIWLIVGLLVGVAFLIFVVQNFDSVWELIFGLVAGIVGLLVKLLQKVNDIIGNSDNNNKGL